MMGRRPLAPLALAALAAILLAGCGGSSGPSSSSSFPTPGASTQHAVPTGEAVAYVLGAPILKTSYQHWLAVEQAMGSAGNTSHRVLGFLITSSWVLGEAGARHITVSEAEVHKHLAEVERRAFRKPGDLQRFLAKSHETTADLMARVKVELLQQRIVGQVSAHQRAGSRHSATLSSFEKNFQAHWKRLTNCLPAYVMEDCAQYKGGPEPQPASAPAPSASGGSAKGSGSASPGSGSSGSGSSGSASPASSSNGEVYSPPGSFALSSSAFELNGAIPVQYTCDGAGISPPLEWQKVPAHASELVLFVIDDSASGSNGGIRWVLGGIDPASQGVAAGKLPAGAIVGTNTAGKAAYGPICPARGHTDTIELVMYALRNKIALSPGFQPAVAEHEYGSTKDLLGQAAVTYAVYHRA